GIPVVAVVDTNCTPEGVDYVIPGNDDALRAVRLFASRIADAILEGQQLAQQKEAEEAALAAERRAAEGVTVEFTPRQPRERGERGERGRGRDRHRGERGERGDRGERRRDRKPRAAQATPAETPVEKIAAESAPATPAEAPTAEP